MKRNLLLLGLLTLPFVAPAQFSFTITNGAITITGYTGYGAVVIPAAINGYPVTAIGSRAFWNQALMSGVTIPDTVTTIGDDAFEYCYSLVNVTIGNSVTSIGDSAFQDCRDLTSVTMPDSVTTIGAQAFFNCTSLTSVTIGNSVTSIGSYAFGNCISLTAAYFQGNTPPDNGTAFSIDNKATIYYLPGTSGWGATFGSLPTALWTLPYPVILSGANGNTAPGVRNNIFGFNFSWATNHSVVVLAATNLVNPVWTPVATNDLINGTFYFSDPQWTNYPGRLYRLRSP